jgi:hypothetical protein
MTTREEEAQVMFCIARMMRVAIDPLPHDNRVRSDLTRWIGHLDDAVGERVSARRARYLHAISAEEGE